MVDYNKGLWKFWERVLTRLKEYKGSTRLLEFRIDKKKVDVYEFLKYKFEGGKKFSEEIEEFVFEISRQIYKTATKNKTAFPATLEDLFKELPFDNTKYASFHEEYLERLRKVEAIKNNFLENYKKEAKELEISIRNLEVVAISLWIKVIGMGENELKNNLPPGFDAKKKYKAEELSRTVFRHLKKEVLEGRTLDKLLKTEKRRKQLLNKILSTTDLPYDWTKRLVKKADLDNETFRANNLQTWKDNHTCSSTGCHESSHSDYSTRHTESQEYQRIHTKLDGKVSDSELQALLEAVPSCSHSDYNTIKEELATSKTELTDTKEKLEEQKTTFEKEKKEAQTQARAQQEKEIIDKIITDLELSTERERERERIY